MKQGDVILAVNGKNVNDPNELRNTVAAMAPGTDVTVTIARNGAEQQFHVKLGELGAGDRASRAAAEAEAERRARQRSASASCR